MKLLFSVLTCALISCASYEPSQTDQGALAGAIVGGGVGAIIGNQAGSTGGGLAIGSIAGAGVGAMIGNQFQEKDDLIDSQSETINQQQRQLQIHQEEIDQLRKSTQDQVAFTNQPSRSNYVEERDLTKSIINKPVEIDNQIAKSSFNETTQIEENLESAPITPVAIVDETKEMTQVSPNVPSEELQPAIAMVSPEQVADQALPEVQPIQEVDSRAAYNWEQEKVTESSAPSAECLEATKEVASAGQAEITAEKLYHFRRAERLCPEEPNVHVGLGKLYLELNRKSEAKDKFQEVLKLDPNNDEVKNLMKQL